MEIQNNITKYNCLSLGVIYNSKSKQIPSESSSVTIFGSINNGKKNIEEETDTPKLSIKNLELKFHHQQIKQDYIKSILIGGAAAGFLFGIISSTYTPIAAILGVAMGALITKCKYSFKIYKNQKKIQELQKYYNKLTSEQKKEINKKIKNDISYAPNCIQSYIKICKKFVTENWTKNFSAY